MKDDQFYADMQRYIAVTTVGPSALRKQGAKGVIKAAQQHLAVANLQIFKQKDELAFLRMLDIETEKLKLALPEGAQNWGAARKALNLFLRDICYNRFLCERHDLASIEEWLELPLDRLVATSLIDKDIADKLPQWPGLKWLKKNISEEFQSFAKQYALEQGVSRIHLDMRLWTVEREKPENLS